MPTIAGRRSLSLLSFLSLLSLALLTSPSPAQPSHPAPHPSNTIALLGDIPEPDHTLIEEKLLPHVLQLIRTTWLPLIPAVSRASSAPLTSVGIRFNLHAGGSVTDMALEPGTRNIDFDKAAWAAITSTGYDTFPPELAAKTLTLRITFVLNAPNP